VTADPSLAAAYSDGAGAWAGGPSRIYRRLAEVLVAASPFPLDGALVLDLGAGTGAGSEAAAAAGAHVVAVDVAFGMLIVDRRHRPPATVGDARSLPCASGVFDAVLASFSINHLPDPSTAVAEAGRVLRPGRVLLASTYAAEDGHECKAAVDQALGEAGWHPPSWYLEVKEAMASWGTIDAAADTIRRGGMTPVLVERRDVTFPDLTPPDLVAWRLGMAHAAPFLAQLESPRRDDILRRALELLGDDPATLVRRTLVLVAT
jgi:SAM-dependent methyltransferase